MKAQQVFTSANAVDTFEIGGGVNGTPVAAILFPCVSVGNDWATRDVSRIGSGFVVYKDSTVFQNCSSTNTPGNDSDPIRTARVNSIASVFVSVNNTGGTVQRPWSYNCTGVGPGGGLLIERVIIDGGDTNHYEMAFNCMVFYPQDIDEVDIGYFTGATTAGNTVTTGFDPNVIFMSGIGLNYAGEGVPSSSVASMFGVGLRNEGDTDFQCASYGTSVADNTASMTCSGAVSNVYIAQELQNSTSAINSVLVSSSNSTSFTATGTATSDTDSYFYLAIKLPAGWRGSIVDFIRTSSTVGRYVWATGKQNIEMTMTTFQSFRSITNSIVTSSTYAQFNSLTDSNSVTATSNWAAYDNQSVAKAKDFTSTNEIRGTNYTQFVEDSFIANPVVAFQTGVMQDFTAVGNSTAGWVFQLGPAYTVGGGSNIYVGSTPIENLG